MSITFENWKPSDSAFIKKFQVFVRTECYSTIDVIIAFLCQTRNGIVGWPDPSKEFYEVAVEFKGVSNLKLNFSGFGIHQISGFDIVDVSDKGWEEVMYIVEDYENGTIEFNCKEINVGPRLDSRIVSLN